MTRVHSIIRLSALALVVGTGSTALAQDGGFAITERGTPDSGASGAGAVARAGDASTAHWNAAGMSRLERPTLLAGIGIAIGEIEADLGGKTVGVPPGAVGNGGDAGKPAPVGGIYFVQPIDDRWAAGFTFNGVFGGAVDYDDDWAGRQLVTFAQLTVANFEPAVSYKVDDKLSLGLATRIARGGFQYELELTPDPAGPTGKVRQEHDWDIGGVVSALYDIDEKTRVGARFSTELEFEFDGSLRAAPLGKAPFEIEFTLPRSLNAGVAHELTQDTTLLADAGWTDWSAMNDTPISVGQSPRGDDAAIPRDWKDSYRVGIGLEHRIPERWTMRTGFAWNSDVARDSRRYPDLPVGESFLISAGLDFAVTRQTTVGLHYTLQLMPGVDMDEIRIPGGTVLDGSYDDARIHFWGITISHDF